MLVVDDLPRLKLALGNRYRHLCETTASQAKVQLLELKLRTHTKCALQLAKYVLVRRSLSLDVLSQSPKPIGPITRLGNPALYRQIFPGQLHLGRISELQRVNRHGREPTDPPG